MTTHAPIERASSNDLLNLAADCGAAPHHVAALLVLSGGPPFDLEAARATLGERIAGLPRLRQRLHRTPPGFGRPIWVDDAGFDLRAHVTATRCPAPGDERALLELAADLVTRRLPRDRPPWAAIFVTGLASGELALLFILHHVLADGLGGLAVLASLVDGVAPSPEPDFPRSAPSRWRLLREALSTRLRAPRRLPYALGTMREALAELGANEVGRAPRTSLNRPEGPRRRFRLVESDLLALRDAAHAYGGTINDAVLTAVAGALRSVLEARGESPGSLVVSVPVSGRAVGSAAQLGNQTGVLAVRLPLERDPAARFREIAASTRLRKRARHGASARLLEPFLRALAALGLLHGFLNHQRRINTFVTNLRGPEQRLSLLGHPLTRLLPTPSTLAGNISVSFAVLSYAGTLTVTLIADPDRCPELELLAAALREELDTLVWRSRARPPRGERSSPMTS
jgi:diacylglycerol O-acyltransferase / wax synthase